MAVRACSTTPINIQDETWLWRNGSLVSVGSKNIDAFNDGVAKCLATSTDTSRREQLVLVPCGKGPNELKLQLAMAG